MLFRGQPLPCGACYLSRGRNGALRGGLRREGAPIPDAVEHFDFGIDMDRFVMLSSALLLAGCGGGGDAGNATLACDYVGGSALAGMSVGGSSNVQDAVDRNLSTFATISSVADGQMIASGGRTVSGGGNAGMFVTPPAGTTAGEITINTRMGQAIVESASGPALDITDVSDTAATNYIGFETTQPYDGIEFLFSTGGEYLIYEFCHSANLGP